MDKVQRLDVLLEFYVKEMLVEISKKDNRSITKEIIHLIKKRYEEFLKEEHNHV